MIKSAMFLTTDKSEEICQLLIEFEFWKVIWIASWIYRFFENCKDKRKLSVPLKKNSTEKAKMFWIKHKQVKIETTDHFKEDQGQPKLQKNGTGIFECKGSSQENNAWGSHIDNGCYQGKLLDSKTETNSKESNQKLFWMKKIPCQTFQYATTRHYSIRNNYKNKTFSSNWYRFYRSIHVSPRIEVRKGYIYFYSHVV